MTFDLTIAGGFYEQVTNAVLPCSEPKLHVKGLTIEQLNFLQRK